MAIAVEQAFVAKDPSAALKIGHARAVALLAAAQADLEIAEYAPNHIKKCVVGVGHAGKEQVQAMIKRAVANGALHPGRCRRCAGRRHHPCPSGRHPGAAGRGRVMIGKLSGRIDTVAEDHVILDVGGVGYLVHCPASTLSRLSEGASVSLAIETRITDETIKLYGFSTAAEREWFRLLQTVQSVGARVALAVLSALAPRDLEKALALGDKAAIGRAQGVGPKLATRIVTELKDKAPAMMLRGGAEPGEVHAATAPKGAEADAVAALVKLGYGARPCRRNGGPRRPRPGRGRPVDALLREALKAAGR